MNSKTETRALVGAVIGACAIFALTTTACSKPDKSPTGPTADATATATAAPKPDLILCKGQFALCNTAPCKKVGDSYRCAPCVIHEGKFSFGKSDCGARDAKVISEFSTLNTTHLKNMKCPVGQVWANCLDAPCEDLGNGTAACTCPPGTPSGPSFTFGGDCHTKTCDGTVWSAFAADETEGFVKAYAAALGQAGGKFVEPSACSQ